MGLWLDVGLCVVHVYHHIVLYRVQTVVLYGVHNHLSCIVHADRLLHADEL